MTVATAPLQLMPADALPRYKHGQVQLALLLLRFRAQLDGENDPWLARFGRDLITAHRASRVLRAGPDATATMRQTGIR